MRFRWLLVGTFGIGLLGCGELAKLQKQQEQTRAELDLLKNRVRNLADFQTVTELELRTIWSRVSCNNESVKEFLRTCEKDESGCTGADVAENFRDFLYSQPYTLSYLRPGSTLDGLAKLRRSQLTDLTQPDNLHVGTRFIIVVLPVSESPEHQQEAERIGRQFVRYLRYHLKVPESNRILGPKTLPCTSKRDVLLRTKKRIDERTPGEPMDNLPTVHVWVFRTDCH
ncbi:MAG TPA: hypothetical protein PKE31_21625 [Pseudomonadota bacterium]|jgi:hypothetical protein|nr:hypothetical protein [Pseudomonadota bacterium]